MEIDFKGGVLYVGGSFLRKNQQQKLQHIFDQEGERIRTFLASNSQLTVMRLGTPREDFVSGRELNSEHAELGTTITSAGFAWCIVYCEWPMQAYAIALTSAIT